MSETEFISIVIPVYNEESNLEELIQRCLAACNKMNRPFEIILVNDGSRDDSKKIITTASELHPGHVIGVFLNRNYGQHSAVMAGFEMSKGQIIVTLDADLQNPPEEIPKLVAYADQGFDVVGSVRVGRQDSLFRRMASLITNKIVRHYTGVMMTDYGCMLRAYRRHIVNAMLECRESTTFIPVLANSFAGHTIELEVRHDLRLSGKSKYGLWKLINLHFDLLTSMSTLPLRLLSVFGVFLSGIGIGFGIYLGLMRLIFGPAWAVQGVFTLFAILFVLVGFQFVGMGLLGEYLGRIFKDVRTRPRYFVESVVGATHFPKQEKGH